MGHCWVRPSTLHRYSPPTLSHPLHTVRAKVPHGEHLPGACRLQQQETRGRPASAVRGATPFDARGCGSAPTRARVSLRVCARVCVCVRACVVVPTPLRVGHECGNTKLTGATHATTETTPKPAVTAPRRLCIARAGTSTRATTLVCCGSPRPSLATPRPSSPAWPRRTGPHAWPCACVHASGVAPVGDSCSAACPPFPPRPLTAPAHVFISSLITSTFLEVARDCTARHARAQQHLGEPCVSQRRGVG